MKQFPIGVENARPDLSGHSGEDKIIRALA
jgi:hypothetical protein